MMRAGTGFALVAATGLSGCAIFEQVLDGLRAEVDRNADQPRFVYGYQEVENTKLTIATLTPEDRGLILGAVEFSFAAADITPYQFSPALTYVAGQFNEYFTDGQDNGLWIVNVEAGVSELVQSDNPAGTVIETGCDLNAVGRDLFADYLAASGDADNELGWVSQPIRVDAPSDQVVVVGWISDEVLAAQVSAEYELRISDEDGALIDQLVLGELSFDLQYERDAGGTWQGLAKCEGQDEVVLDALEQTRNLGGVGGDIVLDGVVLANTFLPDEPMEEQPAAGLIGPVSLAEPAQ